MLSIQRRMSLSSTDGASFCSILGSSRGQGGITQLELRPTALKSGSRGEYWSNHISMICSSYAEFVNVQLSNGVVNARFLSCRQRQIVNANSTTAPVSVPDQPTRFMHPLPCLARVAGGKRRLSEIFRSEKELLRSIRIEYCLWERCPGEPEL